MAFAFLVVMMFATLPSPLYGLYRTRDHLSAFTITVVFAIFAAGTIITLLRERSIVARLGRRGAMLGGVTTMMVAAGLLAAWKALPGLLIGRVLTGVAIGLAAGVAIPVPDRAAPARRSEGVPRPRQEHRHRGERGRARHRPAGRRLPGAVGAAAADAALHRHDRARGGRSLRRGGRARDGHADAADTGHADAPGPGQAASSGGSRLRRVGSVRRVVRTHPGHHAAPDLTRAVAGLALLVVAVRLSTPSLALFLIGGALIGAGAGAVYKGITGIVLEATPLEDRVAMTSALIIAVFVGLSVPVIGAGIALDAGASTANMVLGFAIFVALGVSLSGWALRGRRPARAAARTARRPRGSPLRPPPRSSPHRPPPPRRKGYPRRRARLVVPPSRGG